MRETIRKSKPPNFSNVTDKTFIAAYRGDDAHKIVAEKQQHVYLRQKSKIRSSFSITKPTAKRKNNLFEASQTDRQHVMVSVLELDEGGAGAIKEEAG